jgi:hypothetical protein
MADPRLKVLMPKNRRIIFIDREVLKNSTVARPSRHKEL